MMLKAFKSFFLVKYCNTFTKEFIKTLKTILFFEKISQKEYFQNVMPGHELNVER